MPYTCKISDKHNRVQYQAKSVQELQIRQYLEYKYKINNKLKELQTWQRKQNSNELNPTNLSNLSKYIA